jgi:hypothetical protein
VTLPAQPLVDAVASCPERMFDRRTRPALDERLGEVPARSDRVAQERRMPIGAA